MLFNRHTSRSLASRDPAAAILLGAISAPNGADFGLERNPRMQARQQRPQRTAPFARQMRRDPFGSDPSFGADFGEDNPWGHDPGYNFGFDHYGADAVTAPKPTPAAMEAAWNKTVRAHVANRRREALLEPNKGADAKVERYAMPTAQAITIGTALAGWTILANPTVNIRPQRVTSNAPNQNYVFLLSMSVANVNVLVGPGVQDAYDYASEAVGTSLDIPTLTPSNPIRIVGNYTGFVPANFVVATATFFTMTFIGWASIVA